MAKKFKYKRRSAESVTKRAAQSGSNRHNIFKSEYKVFTPNSGDNVIRILPPTWENAEHYGFDIWVHYRIGTDNHAILDIDKMLGKPNPITEEIERAEAAGEDEEYIKSLLSKKRVLVWIIDRDNEDEGPQLWAMPWTIDKSISALCKDKRTGEILFIDDPEDGYDVEFTKSGKGFSTSYDAIQISRRSSDLGNDEWLDYIAENPLPDCVEYLSYDEIAKAFGSGAANKSRLTDEDDKDSGKSSGKRRSKSKSKRKASRDELEDMSMDELDQFCEDNDIALFADDFDDKDDFIDSILEELD